MTTLPAASALATAAVRRQFAPDLPESPQVRPDRPPAWRVALAALLDRAARALVPAERGLASR